MSTAYAGKNTEMNQNNHENGQKMCVRHDTHLSGINPLLYVKAKHSVLYKLLKELRKMKKILVIIGHPKLVRIWMHIIRESLRIWEFSVYL
jgi:hypothetical protein